MEYTDLPIALDVQNPGGSPTQHFNELTAGSPGTFKVNAQGLWVGNTQIVDENGLNSLNNFRQDRITNIDAFETSSLEFVDVPGGAFDTLTLERTTRILFYINVIGRNRSFEDDEASVGFFCTAEIFDFTTETTKASLDFKGALGFVYTFDAGGDSWASNITSVSMSKTIISSVGAGTHNFGLQLCANDGGIARISDADIGYVILGI